MELNQDVVDRYSRQLILKEISLHGQTKLAQSRILVIGAGGLGCPLTLYCCAAGVGTIGIVDNDCVEVSNLHRQVCHDVNQTGKPKVDSLEETLKALNPLVNIVKFKEKLTRENAIAIFQNFDMIVDCSDNAPTRYLASDASVVLKKPLVSSSALRFEGQLTVYRPFEDDNPCYRCIFPEPPDPSLTGSCSSVGVMGFVCGVMGSLQAQEVVKQIVGLPNPLVKKMLVYDGLSCTFRTIKLRSKSKECKCVSLPTSLDSFEDVVFKCEPSCKVLSDEERLSPELYSKMITDKKPHILIDVRNACETLFSNLNLNDEAMYMNCPIKSLANDENIAKLVTSVESKAQNGGGNTVVVMCKRGNNSQKAVEKLKRAGLNKTVELKDIKGGLFALKDLIPESNIFFY